MRRLNWLVRRSPAPQAYVTAGRGLSHAILATRGEGPLPSWAQDMADVLVGALILVEAKSHDIEDPETRIHLATTAAVLSLVRPEVARACDTAIGIWMGAEASSPWEADNAHDLAARCLLALYLDNLDEAEDCVDALLEREPHGVGGPLHDWVVARRQHHGAGREIECFHHLRLALVGDGTRCRPAVLLTATLVVWSRLDAPRSRALSWLDEIALEAHLGSVAATG